MLSALKFQDLNTEYNEFIKELQCRIEGLEAGLSPRYSVRMANLPDFTPLMTR